MRRIALCIISLALAGCTHAISKESMALVDRSINYDLLKENPDTYQGRFVVVGGAVASVRNTQQGSQLEVVQLPLDSDQMPEQTYRTGGRFIAVINKFLDPLFFKEDRMVTIVGEVKGSMVRPIDQVQYRYPVIAVREMHLWRPEDYQRNDYPPPGYPWYDPWWPTWRYRPYPYGPWWW